MTVIRPPAKILVAALLVPTIAAADDTLTRDQAVESLDKAVTFLSSEAALGGGYVWRYSADLKLRQGEGLAYDERIWVQPPGTPSVGEAFLDAYLVTGRSSHLQAARDAAAALVRGQLHSGGWGYSFSFDPNKRAEFHFRVEPSKGELPTEDRDDVPGGWVVWKTRRHKGNVTVLDDDTTTSALRLLIRTDRALRFEDESIHEAATYGLASLLRSQYPIGAWSHNYDRLPRRPPDRDYYPVKQASHPTTWSRKTTGDFQGCYAINDRITLNAIKTMLLAYEVYEDPTYLGSALRGGDFLLLAQMPAPQPAWAQQYDRKMQPVWDRVFEPPAITGLESQDVLETLLMLYQRTAKKKYLDAVPSALAYLQRSRLIDGKLARFYELETNKPIFFDRNYRLTYKSDDAPDHYQFVVNSRLDAIALRYRIFAGGGSDARLPEPTPEELAEQARHAIETMNQHGAWTEPGWVRDREGSKVEPPGGIIRAQTFIDNVAALVAFIGSPD